MGIQIKGTGGKSSSSTKAMTTRGQERDVADGEIEMGNPIYNDGASGIQGSPNMNRLSSVPFSIGLRVCHVLLRLSLALSLARFCAHGFLLTFVSSQERIRASEDHRRGSEHHRRCSAFHKRPLTTRKFSKQYSYLLFGAFLVAAFAPEFISST